MGISKGIVKTHNETVENAVYDLLMNFEPTNKKKINKIRALYKRFIESDTFNEVYKDKSIGEQIKIKD